MDNSTFFFIITTKRLKRNDCVHQGNDFIEQPIRARVRAMKIKYISNKRETWILQCFSFQLYLLPLGEAVDLMRFFDESDLVPDLHLWHQWHGQHLCLAPPRHLQLLPDTVVDTVTRQTFILGNRLKLRRRMRGMTKWQGESRRDKYGFSDGADMRSQTCS